MRHSSNIGPTTEIKTDKKKKKKKKKGGKKATGRKSAS
jgi:hypothetical protein